MYSRISHDILSWGYFVGETETGDYVALTANFNFVARDLKIPKSAPVNRLVPQTEQEKVMVAEGEARDMIRKKERQRQGKEFEEGHRMHGDGERLKYLLREGCVLCGMPTLVDREKMLINGTRLENALIFQ